VPVETTFQETAPLSTYLFAFVAGKFSGGDRAAQRTHAPVLHRETDAAKVARNREALFDLHAKALDWLEDYTDIKYPWASSTSSSSRRFSSAAWSTRARSSTTRQA
jgi:aminopeptidase N